MDPIVQNGDPVLRQKAAPVEKQEFGSAELIALIDRMSHVLEDEVDQYSVGVALAAPQIGVSKRIFVVRMDRTGGKRSDGTLKSAEIAALINPRITRTSHRRIPMDEGCLSVRRKYGFVPRFERATVEAYDVNGKKFTRGAGGLLAQIFQHEIDHLDGVLFIDHAQDVWDQIPDAA
jgi:peptide deformylase